MDNLILQRLTHGDKTALEEIYRKNRESFINFALKYHPDKEDILDVYQDVIIALYEKSLRGSLILTTGNLKTYLFSMGKFMIFNRFKEISNIESINETNIDHHLLAVTENLYSKDQKDPKIIQIEKALQSMGPKCQNLLRLFYYEEKKMIEIQEILKYNHTDVVKSQKSRCLKSLKEAIAKSQKIE
jgi:RNA polymerase sigma factor (sigma-70 family)